MAGLIRGAMEFTYPTGNQCVMTFHCGLFGAPVPTDATADAVRAVAVSWWDTGVSGEGALKANCNALCVLNRVTTQVIQPTPAGTVRETLVTIPGTAPGGNGLPPQLAAVISLRTVFAGRSFRGRMYLPGLDETFADSGGTMASATAQAIADSAEGFRRALEDIELGAGALVVFSRKNNTFASVAAIRVGTRLDTQRRRKIRETTYVVGA